MTWERLENTNLKLRKKWFHYSLTKTGKKFNLLIKKNSVRDQTPFPIVLKEGNMIFQKKKKMQPENMSLQFRDVWTKKVPAFFT